MEKITIRANYSFWRHPIKWFRERKMRHILQLFMDQKYPDLAPEIRKAQIDMMFYGGAFLKGDKHIPFLEGAEKFYSP